MRVYLIIAGILLFASAALYINHIFNLAGQVPGLELQIKQLQADKEQCQKDKLITEGVSHDYQAKYTVISRKLANRLRQPARCVMLATSKAPGLNAAPSNGIATGQNGLSSGWLYQYAGEAEQYRLQLVGLQDFVNKTWQSKGQ